MTTFEELKTNCKSSPDVVDCLYTLSKTNRLIRITNPMTFSYSPEVKFLDKTFPGQDHGSVRVIDNISKCVIRNWEEYIHEI